MELEAVPVFVLDGASDRRERMEGRLRRLGLLPQTTFLGVVERDDPAVLEVLSSRPEEEGGEVASLLSALRALRLFLRTGKEWGLVLQDDLLPANDFRERWEKYVPPLPDLCSLLLLSFLVLSWDKTWKVKDLYTTIGPGCLGAMAYLVSREWAEEVVEKFSLPPGELDLEGRYGTEQITAFAPGGLKTDQPLFLGEALGRPSWHRDYFATFGYENFSRWEGRPCPDDLPVFVVGRGGDDGRMEGRLGLLERTTFLESSSAALRSFLRTEKEWAMVLEDRLLFADDFPEQLAKFCAALPPDRSLFLLSVQGPSGEGLFSPLEPGVRRAYGYVLDRKRAREMEEGEELFAPGVLRCNRSLLLEEGSSGYQSFCRWEDVPPLEEIPVFVINLPRSTDRRKRMEGRLRRLGLLSRTTFVEGAEPEEEEVVSVLRSYSGNTTPRQAACLRSHLRAVRAFSRSGRPWGLILEDDAMPANDFPSKMPEYLAALPPDRPLALFSFYPASWEGMYWLNDKYTNIGRRCFGACAYLLSAPYAARALLSYDRPLAAITGDLVDGRCTSELLTLNSGGAKSGEHLFVEECLDSYVQEESDVASHRDYYRLFGFENFSRWEEKEGEEAPADRGPLRSFD